MKSFPTADEIREGALRTIRQGLSRVGITVFVPVRPRPDTDMLVASINGHLLLSATTLETWVSAGIRHINGSLVVQQATEKNDAINLDAVAMANEQCVIDLVFCSSGKRCSSKGKLRRALTTWNETNGSIVSFQFEGTAEPFA